MMMRRTTICLFLAYAACMLQSASCAVRALQPVANGPGWIRYDMVVSIAQSAPDCFERAVILINGMKSPAIEVEAGSTLYVNVINRIPKDYPSVYDGISIHWHGLTMHREASWYDGVAYADQCPIAPSTNFTYAFKVDEIPGTYFWHDHAFAWKADGLQGPLIVRPPAGRTEPFTYDGEHIMMINDWWHTPANVMAMKLNRPFDPARVTSDSGSWLWVGNPQAILINGNGYYNDCQLYPGQALGPGPAACNASVFSVPRGRSSVQPWAADTNPGCTHEVFRVQKGLTYRFRIIGATELLYTTVCFEGHNVTIVAADAIPVEPYRTTCVDVNAGQRYDVLLTADLDASNYWISVQQQFRQGAPSGYAVLSYEGAAQSALPTTPTPQPLVSPWSLAAVQKMTIKEELLTPAAANSSWALYQQPRFNLATLAPPKGTADRTIVVQLSQPIFNATGVLRWALNNIMTPTTPVCEDYRQSIRKDPKWLIKNAVGGAYGAGQKIWNTTVGNSGPIRVLEYGKGPAPSYPTVGLHIVSIEEGEVIDVVLQNNPANAFNGDYTPNGSARTAMEQHPFHMHGYHFWVLGTGLGYYDPNNSSLASSLNLVNPVMRDTVTLPLGGWAVIRFRANNPGVWPLHCHILWHHFMGQQLQFVESPSAWTAQPKNFPKCPKKCVYNTAPYSNSWVQARYGNTGYSLPLP